MQILNANLHALNTISYGCIYNFCKYILLKKYLSSVVVPYKNTHNLTCIQNVNANEKPNLAHVFLRFSFMNCTCLIAEHKRNLYVDSVNNTIRASTLKTSSPLCSKFNYFCLYLLFREITVNYFSIIASSCVDLYTDLII